MSSRITLPLLLVLASACASERVQVKPLTAAMFPPSPAVTVLAFGFPEDREYSRLAELSVERGPGALEELKSKARDLGAHAIVIVEIERGQDQLVATATALNPSAARAISRPGGRVRVVAIRYEGDR